MKNRIEIKKILLLTVALFVCFSVVANDYCWVEYADGTIERYWAEHTQTGLNIDSQYRYTNPEYSIHDDSIFEKSKKESREDYDKLYEKINSTHPGVISPYEKFSDGQTIHFYKDKISKMYKYKR